MEILSFLIEFGKEILLKNKKLNPKNKEFKSVMAIIYLLLALSIYTNIKLLEKIYSLGIKIYQLENKCKK